MSKNVKSGAVNSLDIDKLLNSVKKSYGKTKGLSSQVTMGNTLYSPTKDSEFVCWKNSPWEMVTGTRGVPFGRVVQIAGRPDSGKSSHAMKFMKAAEDQDVFVILWDVENKFSARRYDKHMGGNSSKLVVIPSKMILEGADQVERVINAVKEQNPNIKILLVWDSVGGSLASNEGEGSLVNSKQMAAAAKENGQAIRAFVRLMEKYKNKETNEETIAVLCINQTYANIGSHGQKESGGQKVEYYSSIIVQLTRKSDLTKVRDGIKRKTGIVSKMRVRKNHLFDGEDSIAELDIIITAGDIKLLNEIKTKKVTAELLNEDDDIEEVEEQEQDE